MTRTREEIMHDLQQVFAGSSGRQHSVTARREDWITSGQSRTSQQTRAIEQRGSPRENGIIAALQATFPDLAHRILAELGTRNAQQDQKPDRKSMILRDDEVVLECQIKSNAREPRRVVLRCTLRDESESQITSSDSEAAMSVDIEPASNSKRTSNPTGEEPRTQGENITTNNVMSVERRESSKPDDFQRDSDRSASRAGSRRETSNQLPSPAPSLRISGPDVDQHANDPTPLRRSATNQAREAAEQNGGDLDRQRAGCQACSQWLELFEQFAEIARDPNYCASLISQALTHSREGAGSALDVVQQFPGFPEILRQLRGGVRDISTNKARCCTEHVAVGQIREEIRQQVREEVKEVLARLDQGREALRQVERKIDRVQASVNKLEESEAKKQEIMREGHDEGIAPPTEHQFSRQVSQTSFRSGENLGGLRDEDFERPFESHDTRRKQPSEAGSSNLSPTAKEFTPRSGSFQAVYPTLPTASSDGSSPASRGGQDTPSSAQEKPAEDLEFAAGRNAYLATKHKHTGK